MNKKGFTLVELIISIVLLSMVSLFVIKIVSNIKTEEENIADESTLILNKNIISKVLNETIASGGGIESMHCSDSSALLSLKDNTSISLSISNKVLTVGNVILKRDLINNYNISCVSGSYINTVTLTNGTSEYDIIVTSLK